MDPYNRFRVGGLLTPPTKEPFMNTLNHPVPIALAILTFLAAAPHAGGAELGKQQSSQNPGASSGPSSTGSQSMLTDEQRTKLRPILQRNDAPKATQINFALTPGTQVPTQVRAMPATPELVAIHPEWRDHQYFVANDQIVVIDRQHKIVEVLTLN